MSKMYLTSLVSEKSITGCFKKKAFSRFFSVGLLLLILFSSAKTNAQVLAWQLFGKNGDEASVGATTIDANINNTPLVRGAGIAASLLGNAYAATNWETTTTTQALAQTANEYFQFSLTPKNGFTASLSSISYHLRRSNTGPDKYIWRYSLDGTTFIDIAATLNTTFTSTVTGGTAFGPIVISGITALQNIPSTTTVTFRLYAWGGTGGTFAIGRSTTSGATDYSLLLSGTTAAGGPLLAVSPSSRTGFNYVFGSGPSSAQSFLLSGTNLIVPGTITISTSPLAPHYETSLDNITFNSVDKTFAISAVTLGPTAVYVRLKAGLAVGSYDSELINCSGGGSADKTVNCDGSVSPSSASDVIAVAASESATIPSTQNAAAPLAIGTGAQVWSFTIRDGGGSSDADLLPTIVNSITFAQPVGNNTVSNWNQAIKTISLFDGATPVTATVTITPTQIQFTGMSLSVPDNTNKTITVRLSLNCGIGGSNYDGDHFGFSLSNANFTTASVTTSSQKNPVFGAAVSLSGANVIDVAATQLNYSQQPSNVGVNASINPAVIVTATDACGNIDKNFSSTVTITSNGTLTNAQAEVAVSGIATFANVSFSAAGTGIKLTATAPAVSLVISNSFTVSSTTTLNPGDLMIVGFDTYTSGSPAGEDKLSITNLVPLLTNTKFIIANMVYEITAGANFATGRWYNGNGNLAQSPPYIEVQYTGPLLVKGSVICITIANSGGGTSFSVNGSPSPDFTVITPSSFVQFSSSNADAFFLMQGTFSADDAVTEAPNVFKTFSGTVFGAIQIRGTFTPFSVAGGSTITSNPAGDGLRISRIYPTLACISISMPGGAGNTQGYYGYYKSLANGGLHTGTQHQLISAIGNVGANWTTSLGGVPVDDLATTNTCSNTFNPTTNVAYGYWVGTATSKDWYDCNNWDNLAVPDANIDVTIDGAASNDCQLDANGSANAAKFGNKGDAKSVTLNGGHKLIIEYTGAIANRLDIAGNMKIAAANALDMNDGSAITTDGTINIKGNWNNSFATGFDAGNSLVNFNSSVATQTITTPDGETFYNLTNSNSVAGGVVLANTAANVTVTNTLLLSNGLLSINNNTLTLNGTIGAGTGTFTGSNNSILSIGGTAGGSLGTINFTAGNRLLNTLNLNRTGAGAMATLGTDLSVSSVASITAGILDAGTFTLNGAGGLTMSGGELQIGKTGTTVPELSGTYALTAGVVNFKGTGSQTIRAVNYFNLTSTSTGVRVMANAGTVGVASIFTPGSNIYTFTGSTVDYNGSGAQNIANFVSGVSSGSTYNNLTLSNAGIKSLIANTDVEGDLGLNNSVTFALGNNYLNLRSTATQTARVAPVSSSANLTYGVTGNFVVERYFPGRRAWRLITAPVTADASKTLFNSWQAGAASPAGNGTYISGPGETSANGLDITPQHNYSLKTFNQSNSQFEGVGNTKNTFISGITGTVGVPDNIGYFMFVRGDRTSGNPDPFNPTIIGNSTTLRDTGKIQTQSYSFDCNPSISLNKYTLIGNPYASPVDFATLGRSGVVNKFQAWDPKLNAVGAYVVVDLQFGLTISPAGSTQTQVIQSKQAFLVETYSASSPTVTFTEAAKSNVDNRTLFRPGTRRLPSLAVNLHTVKADGTTVLADGALAQFDRQFSDETDQYDALKFTNVNETFSIVNKSIAYILERRKPVNKNDTIFLSLKRSRQIHYRFNCILNGLAERRLAAYLEDGYLHSKTPLNMEGDTWIDFEITANAASAAVDRFHIVFKKTVKFGDIKAHIVSRDAAVEWDVKDEDGIRNYEVERSSDGMLFTSIGTVNVKSGNAGAIDYNWLDINPEPGIYFYRIKSVTDYGAVDYSEMVKIKIAKSKEQLYVYPNPVSGGVIGLQMNLMPAGNYGVSLLNASGQAVLNKNIFHTDASTEMIGYPASLTAGAYKLEVTGADRRRSVINILISSK